MAGFLDFLGGNNLEQIITNVSKETGVSSSQASSVIETAVPLLMGAFQNNSLGENANNLLGALQSDKHNGSLLDNVGAIFSNDKNEITKDGAGILGHLLGGNQSKVTDIISSKTGVSSSNVTTILQTIAPILMSFLGKKVSENNVTSSKGLGDLLSGFLGGNNGSGNLLTSLLDSNKDGNVLDDITGMISGKSDGIGGLMGGIFGKK